MAVQPGKLISGRRGFTEIEYERDHKTDPDKKIVYKARTRQQETTYKWYSKTQAEVDEIAADYPYANISFSIVDERSCPPMYNVEVTVQAENTGLMDISKKTINITKE